MVLNNSQRRRFDVRSSRVRNAVGLGERARGTAGSTAEGEEEGGGSVADDIPLRRMMMTMILMVIALLRVAMVVVLRMAEQAGRAAQTHQRRGER